MAEDRDRLVVGPSAGLADQVRARVAATKLQVQRARQRVAQAMAQVRHVDQLLQAGSADDPAWASGAAVDLVAEVMRIEGMTHLEAVEMHGAAAELRDARDWPARAGHARAYAARARAVPAGPGGAGPPPGTGRGCPGPG